MKNKKRYEKELMLLALRDMNFEDFRHETNYVGEMNYPDFRKWLNERTDNEDTCYLVMESILIILALTFVLFCLTHLLYFQAVIASGMAIVCLLFLIYIELIRK